MKHTFSFLAFILLLPSLGQAQTPNPTDMRIKQLESALMPHSARSLAQAWAQAAKDRNGAVQYMLMCAPLQQANLKNLEELNWVTGVSSPEISQFQMKNLRRTGDGFAVGIDYSLSLNRQVVGHVIEQLSIKPVADEAGASSSWCIDKFRYLSPASARTY